MKAPIVVLKFGSSVLRSLADLPEAVHEIYRHWRAGKRVVAVVSALGNTTDELLGRARGITREPAPEALAALLASGERAAVEYLALALQESGLPARSLAPERAGVRVAGPTLDSEPAAIDAAALERLLVLHPILVLPGFVGLDEEGHIALLGRGGSDLTALALAAALGAERCLLLKDVDGLYERDPALPGPEPRRFATLTYADALALDEGIVQRKAIRHAERTGTVFEVGRIGGLAPTRIGPGSTRAGRSGAPRTLRVALAGLGTVGAGVLRELRRTPERFAIVGVSSRSRERLEGFDLPRELWHADPRELLERRPDVLVELTGAREAEAWIRTALARGIDVVSAHKELLARRGGELETLAAVTGASLACSAAVGGALPALECVRRQAAAGPIARIEGVLNATTNLLLTLGEEGATLAQALERARALGCAETDVERDLDGRDARAKLALLVRGAFGVVLDPDELPTVRLDARLLAEARRARAGDGCLRLVARAACSGTRIQAELAAVRLPARHALAARGAENRLLVTRADGAREWLVAAGAGRGPTTVAVLADLLELTRVSGPGGRERQAVRA